MGTYLYANIGTKFMGTWVDDRMQGPGQLVHERHRFHGFWKSNLVHEIYEIKIEKKSLHDVLELTRCIFTNFASRMRSFR